MGWEYLLQGFGFTALVFIFGYMIYMLGKAIGRLYVVCESEIPNLITQAKNTSRVINDFANESHIKTNNLGKTIGYEYDYRSKEWKRTKKSIEEFDETAKDLMDALNKKLAGKARVTKARRR